MKQNPPDSQRSVRSDSAHSMEQKYRAPALEKGLDVLELLAAQRHAMSLIQISSHLDRSVSELFRMVQVLEFRGYVQEAESGGGYVLTDKLFALGMTRAPSRDLVEAALPRMRRFSEKAREACHLVVASGDQMVVVARVETPGDVGFSVRVGFRRPLVAATSGLVLYAFQPEPTRAEWKTRLSATVSRAAWKDFETRAQAVRTRGYARVPSDVTKGVIDISAPVMHLGQAVAALTCPHLQMREALTVEETTTALKLAARQLSDVLSGIHQAAER